MEKTCGDAFITLMHVAKSDIGMRAKIVALLQLNPDQRKRALNTMLDEMKLNGAPVEIQKAMSCFLDDKVASEAFKFLRPNPK